MITNTGKNILAKYLVGQAPAYASYIAVGCGANPLSTVQSFADYSNKQVLDFEMFRAPIVSRGYISDVDQATITDIDANGVVITYTANNNFVPGDIVTITGTNVAAFNIENAVIATASSTEFTVNSTDTGTYNPSSGGVATKTTSNIVFTAELPTEERYEITEVGVYSAAANPSAGANDSKTLIAFSQTENWEYHDQTAATDIPTISRALDTNDDGTPGPTPGEIIDNNYIVFQTNADNSVFDGRTIKGERSRFLNNMMMIRGDMSDITVSGSNLVPSPTTNHIHLNGVNFNLDKNAPTDLIKVAFSVVNKTPTDPAPAIVRLVIDFASEDLFATTAQYARFEAQVLASELTDNRYVVLTKELQQLTKTPGFNWAAVSIVKVAASITSAIQTPLDNYYLALDAIRIENISSINPLYGMTGYSVIKTIDGSPVVKESNTSSLVEFRFAMDVQ